MLEQNGTISKEQANLERWAVTTNSYLHPYWDYLKYPTVNLYKNQYSNSVLNVIYEVIEDEYGDDILVYSERR